MINSLIKYCLLCGTACTLIGCAADDPRLVGRWTELNSLSCDGYRNNDPGQAISMLRFNQDGHWALSYTDGQLIFKGTYEAWPTTADSPAFSSALKLTIEDGVYDPAKVKLQGFYQVEDNYLVLHDIFLDNTASKSLCGHSFKRR